MCVCVCVCVCVCGDSPPHAGVDVRPRVKQLLHGLNVRPRRHLVFSCHRMYQLNRFGKSTSPQNRQLIVY